MTRDRDLLALEDTVYVTVQGISGFSWQRSHKLRLKKNEGNGLVSNFTRQQ